MKLLNKVRTRISLARTATYHASLGRVTMYDSISVGSLPRGAAAYAGYVNGSWATWPSLVSSFVRTGAELLSIDVFGNGFAHCLDVEPGDAGDATVLPWFRRMKAAGVPCPVIYTSASNVQTVINILMGAGYKRTDFLIWSAHYTYSAHICAPSVCGEPAADGTQWSDRGPGNCDVSALASYFFPWTLGQTKPPVPVPLPPPGPKPYPAPNAIAQDHTVFNGVFEPVVVDGKLLLDYTVQCVQLNGTVHSTQRVTQPEFTLTGLSKGWAYKVLVWANNGPVAPPHAELDITA